MSVGGCRLQAGEGPFEGAVDRFDGRVEHVGHLVGVESEDVAQDEHGELARRQDLQGGDEGQGDGFGLLIPGLGHGKADYGATGFRGLSSGQSVLGEVDR